MSLPEKTTITARFREIQTQIISRLEETDAVGKFIREPWTREEGGGGLTCIMQGGRIIEKGGVNFSEVYGQLPDKIRKALAVESSGFYATGVSIVLHPGNPHIPIIHMNIRYFELDSGEYWFGGGIDLTPHYIIPEQAREFHQKLKDTCDHHHPEFYPRFKKWADDYFFIRHRNETRGIGGIFFDRLNESYGSISKERIFHFVCDVGNTFAPIYCKLMQQNAGKTFSEDQKRWQFLRRGRYVEFNLVYDKGTKFGLDTGGRIESILMSLPSQANWEYNMVPSPGSQEEYTLQNLIKEKDWLK